MGLLKNLAFGGGLLKAEILGKGVPFLVQFSITSRCNLRCIYCYAQYYERKVEDLPTEDVFKIIDGLAEMGTRRINLVGGEPLLRRDVGEIISRVKGAGMECAMTSNGFFVPKRIEEIRDLDLLCLSFDGDEEAHDAHRGAGAHKKVMAAMEAARENGIPLQLATVLTRANLDSIDFILDTARRYNAMVGFTTLINQSTEGGKAPIKETPTDEEYRATLKKILEAKRKGAPVLFSEKAYNLALRWPDYKVDKIIGAEPEFPHPKCHAGRYFCIIDVNGDVYPCPQLVGVIPSLNCLQHGIREAFEFSGRHGCKACHIPCSIDFNLLFSLEPGAIYNILQNYRRGS